VAGVDAAKIALKYGLGSKTALIINTVIIGAFARLAGATSGVVVGS
jgi:Pyruvate/2-oxoacid:ferredoxin oxidoreductase gamma subunit